MGRLVRLRNSLRQALCSLCTSVVSWTGLPVSILMSCCTCVNMPLYPATSEVMLRSSPRSLCNLRSDVECAFLGMAASAAHNFFYHL